MRKRFFFLLVLLLCVPLVAFAHSGGTDAYGGHYDSSTGTYHYHHGYKAHFHSDGVCPYAYDDRIGADSRPSAGSSSGSTHKVQPDTASSDDSERHSPPWWILPIIPLPLILAFSLLLCPGKRKVKSSVAGGLPPVSPVAASPAASLAPKCPHKLVVSDAVSLSFDGRDIPLYRIHAVFLLRVGYLRDTETLFTLFFGDPAVHAFFHVPLSLCSDLVRSDHPDLYFFDHIDGNFEYAAIPFSR